MAADGSQRPVTSPRGCPGRRRRAGRRRSASAGDRRDLVVGELEAEDVEVLRAAARGRRLRDRQRAELHVPAQDHLAGGDAVRLGGRGDRGLRRAAPAACPAGSTPRCGCRAARGPRASRSCGKCGCSSIWLTAGVTPVSSMIRSRCSSVKLETPIERTSPSLAAARPAPARPRRTCPTLGLGQWMRCRSRWSSPSRSSDPRTEAIASSYAWWRPGSLLADLTSSRGTPERRIASPTSRLVLVVHRGVEQPVAGLERAARSPRCRPRP